MATIKFEVNRLYGDFSCAFFVVKRTANFVSFKNATTNEITRKKVSTSSVRGETYETVNLTNFYGRRIQLSASPIMKEYVNDTVADVKKSYETLNSQENAQTLK